MQAHTRSIDKELRAAHGRDSWRIQKNLFHIFVHHPRNDSFSDGSGRSAPRAGCFGLAIT